MTKIIGIPLHLMGDTSVGVGISYLEFICRFGTPRIITPQEVLNPPEVDLLIAPGGVDLSPESYGAVPGYRTSKASPILEHFDAKILPQYIERQTPIFAICRGMQRIWAMYGGRIEQHNGWHDQSKHQYDQCHELSFTEQFKNMSKHIKKVTSRHHQCADASAPYGVPEELNVVAYAKGQGDYHFKSIVEIFEHRTLPIFGVQFHPEDHDSTDELSSMVINKYLNI